MEKEGYSNNITKTGEGFRKRLCIAFCGGNCAGGGCWKWKVRNCEHGSEGCVYGNWRGEELTTRMKRIRQDRSEEGLFRESGKVGREGNDLLPVRPQSGQS